MAHEKIRKISLLISLYFDNQIPRRDFDFRVSLFSHPSLFNYYEAAVSSTVQHRRYIHRNCEIGNSIMNHFALNVMHITAYIYSLCMWL